MKRVFVDSSGFYALLVREDAFHDRAHDLFTRADAERWSLVTMNAVVFEAYALLLTRSRPGRENALKFLAIVEGDAYQVERVRKTDEERAVALLRTHADKTYSLCDAGSFVVMDRLAITDTLAFDRHFREYGRFASSRISSTERIDT